MGARGGIVRLCTALTLCPLTFQGMITLILATDMARHAEIMDSFKEKMENFDYSNEEHMTLVRRLGDLSGGLVHESRPPTQPGSRDTRILTLALEGGVTQAGFQSHTSYPGEPPRGPLSCLGASFPIPPSRSGLEVISGEDHSSCSGFLRIKLAFPGRCGPQDTEYQLLSRDGRGMSRW